jgi:hypothetical protein
MAFNFGDIPLILQELRRYFASKAQGTLADSALQPGAIGSTVQAYDADLAAVAAITTTGGIKRTGANTWTTFPLTATGEAVTGAADAAAARTALGVTIGSNVQAWDVDLDAIAAISTTGPIERTGAGTWAVSDRVRLFGGNGRGTNTDFSTTGNTTLGDGLYYFRDFTVNTGHTVTISRFARIYCSGTFTVQSGATITVTQAARAQGAGHGMSGADQRILEIGNLGGVGAIYNPFVFPFGSPGAGGSCRTEPGGVIQNVPQGGDGGGAIWVEANGAISISGTITAIGENGSAANSPSGNYISTGGGGGSGGAIMLTSLASITIASTATLSVRGGNGANGTAGGIANARGYGGSGGGGGWVWLTAPTVTTTGATITLSGGTAGSQGSTGGTATNTEGIAWGGSFAGGGGTSAIGASGGSGTLVTRTYKAVA